MKTRNICIVGLVLFVISYVFFSQGALSAQKSIDLAHWFNLIGAVCLLSFNTVFPKKNSLHAVASFLTGIGVITHIALCTIDFIMWSFDTDAIGRNALSEQISNTPLILYPFVIVGPSMLFVGLAAHALNFIKTNPIPTLMVLLGGPFVGLSYFIWNNGYLMLASCVLFASGLGLLLYTNEIQNDSKREQPVGNTLHTNLL